MLASGVSVPGDAGLASPGFVATRAEGDRVGGDRGRPAARARIVRRRRFDRVGRDDGDRRRRRRRRGRGGRVVDGMDGDGPCHRPVEHAPGGRRDDRRRREDTHQLLRLRRRPFRGPCLRRLLRLRPLTLARRGHRARRVLPRLKRVGPQLVDRQALRRRRPLEIVDRLRGVARPKPGSGSGKRTHAGETLDRNATRGP